MKGVFDWRSAKVQREHERTENEAKRKHEEAENEAKRDDERRADQWAHRQKQIEQWREGLAAAHVEYQRWLSRVKNEPPRYEAFTNPDIPDAAGTTWFQSLRPHLSDSVESADFRHVVELHCSSEIMVLLTEEINRVEQEWQHEAGA